MRTILIFSDTFSIQNHYSLTIHKAIINKDFDISINVDGAGTVVMGRGVYYPENLAGGEPLLYKCLKVIL